MGTQCETWQKKMIKDRKKKGDANGKKKAVYVGEKSRKQKNQRRGKERDDEATTISIKRRKAGGNAQRGIRGSQRKE